MSIDFFGFPRLLYDCTRRFGCCGYLLKQRTFFALHLLFDIDFLQTGRISLPSEKLRK